MDYVKPADLVGDVIAASVYKARLSVGQLLLRGAFSGAILGCATSLAQTVVSQGVPAFVGALLFPVGFVMLLLLGFELATGNFALLTVGKLDGKLSWPEVLRNWSWVYLGNLLGALGYAFLFYFVVTNGGTSDGGQVAATVIHVAEKKTLAYKAVGMTGLGVAFVKAILCNWMVCIGTVLNFSSKSVIGKVAAMWLPVLTFFALAYEHSVVNMYAIPAGILFGGSMSWLDWWVWNLIPVTLGNIVGGALFLGWGLHKAHRSAVGAPVAATVAADTSRM